MKVCNRGSQVVLVVKNLLANAGDVMRAQFLSWEDTLEGGMATHPSILARKIPWTEEPGGLWSTRSPRIEHDWNNLACIHDRARPCFWLLACALSTAGSVTSVVKTFWWLESIKGSDHGHLVDYILIKSLPGTWAPRLLASPILFY